MRIKVAIVDDNHFLVKVIEEKLSLFEHISVPFFAYNGEDCLGKLEADTGTDLILMDIDMPVLNGIEATKLIKKNYPHIKIIMLTVFDDDENILKAIQAGADGYLLKDTSAEELKSAIHNTLEGGAVMTPSIAMKTLHLLRSPWITLPEANELDVQLSKREIDVLEQLSTGLPFTSIAHNLNISPNTVRRHMENIYKKLQVHSKLEAVDLARKNRLI